MEAYLSSIGSFPLASSSSSIKEKYEWNEKSPKSRTTVQAPQTSDQVPSYRVCQNKSRKFSIFMTFNSSTRKNNHTTNNRKTTYRDTFNQPGLNCQVFLTDSPKRLHNRPNKTIPNTHNHTSKNPNNSPNSYWNWNQYNQQHFHKWSKFLCSVPMKQCFPHNQCHNQ